jgi:hypothetical protein
LTGITGYELDVRVAKSCYVQQGRNDLIGQAVSEGFDDIVFIDDDVSEWSVPHVLRILSHNVDIVGGCYSKKVDGEPKWTFHAASDVVDEDGLAPANDVPTGFLRIRTKCLAAIREKFPWRSYQHQGEPERFEFFPMGLVGPGTPEWIVREIAALIKGSNYVSSNAIEVMINARFDASHRQLLGEDVSFCRLARESGLKLYADTKCRLRHLGDIGYPAKTLPL